MQMTRNLAMLIFNDVEVLDFCGPFEVFSVASHFTDPPAFNVFTRRDGTIRHFWSAEMTGSTADPGQDPRGAPDPAPLWMVLDCTPDGRGEDWYPELDYDNGDSR